LDDRRRDGWTNSTLRIKEQGTHLTLNEHDDDDDLRSGLKPFRLFDNEHLMDLFVGNSFGYSGVQPVPFDLTLHGYFKKTKLNTGIGL